MRTFEYARPRVSEGARRIWRLVRRRRFLVATSVVVAISVVAVVYHTQRQGSSSEKPVLESTEANNGATTATLQPTLAAASIPTLPPSSVPTSTPSQEPSSSPQFCDSSFDCRTDRLGHESPLYSGQAICNDEDRYRFGLTAEGVFQWMDCETQEKRILFNETRGDFYFIVQKDATFQVFETANDTLLWERECLFTIEVYEECLPKPLLDCPYLHLHKDGVVVLAWIENRDWQEKNIKRAYEDLFND